MNVQRFTGRNARDAMQKMRAALGDQAVVLSTRQGAGEVEMLAMAPQALAQVEARAARAPAAPSAAPLPAAPADPGAEVQDDVQRLAMSTLSFQDYVRERLLKKRQAALQERPAAAAASQPAAALPTLAEPLDGGADPVGRAVEAVQARVARRAEARAEPRPEGRAEVRPEGRREQPAEEARAAAPARARETALDPALMAELRAMKGLIEERFGALAFMDRLQRHPAQVRLTQRLLDCGFSAALVRKLADGHAALPEGSDEMAWAAGVLERNLRTAEDEAPLEAQGGVFALIGPTGVGKTTSTAKLAAAFATRHGAAQLGLITLDAYRVGAQEQLRTYGRILGVPVHTAHDRASLEDLLELLAGKSMVLIDTAGLAQRDARNEELLDMLAHPSIRKLLVLNAASQGETLDEVLERHRPAQAEGVVLSKLDEAVKLAPALDALIRHRMKVLAVANGQRVPEDWHRLGAAALVQHALRGGGSAAWRHAPDDLSLVFSTPGPATEPASRTFPAAR